MIRKIGLICVIAGMTQGCSGLGGWVKRAERTELPPINVSGTTYKVFELSDTDKDRLPSRQNSEDTFAVYAIVGPGKNLYCGSTAAGCERAIRRFIERPLNSGVEFRGDGGM